MCGRFALLAAGDEIAQLCGLAEAPDLPARYNVAPTQPIAAVRSEDARRALVLRGSPSKGQARRAQAQ
jgi:putative SOS response-associated peptidase YedK